MTKSDRLVEGARAFVVRAYGELEFGVAAAPCTLRGSIHEHATNTRPSGAWSHRKLVYLGPPPSGREHVARAVNPYDNHVSDRITLALGEKDLGGGILHEFMESAGDRSSVRRGIATGLGVEMQVVNVAVEGCQCFGIRVRCGT